MTIKTGVMAMQYCDFDVIYDVIVTSSDVVRAKKLYVWNQPAKRFDLRY